MKKSVITLGTAAILLSSSLFASPALAERSLSDVRSERSEIKQELSKAEQEVAKIVEKINKKNAEIEQLQAAIDENNKQLKQTKKQIEKLENEIAELQKEIDALQQKIDERDEIIKRRIASYQETGGNIKFIEVLMGAETFTDLISRASAAITITKADQELLDEQKRDQELVIAKQDEVEGKLAEQEDLLAELKEMKKLMDEQKADLKEEKNKLKKEEQKLKNKISELNLKDNQLARIEASLTMPTQVISLSNSSNSGSSGGSSGIAYTGGGKSAIAAASQFVGKTRYAFGAQNPSAGLFDCSGFVQWAYAQEGISLPRSTSGQASAGRAVPVSEMKPGDLVFFDTYKKNGHVGIYVGNGKFIGSQNSTGVAYADMTSGYWKSKFKGHVRRVK